MGNVALFIPHGAGVLVSAYLLARWTDDPVTTVGLLVIVAVFGASYMLLSRRGR
jgi:hypothetical protein